MLSLFFNIKSNVEQFLRHEDLNINNANSLEFYDKTFRV